MSDDLRTQALKWFVETGYVDGGGIGNWDSTEESVEVESQAAANALRDEWIKQGKLIRTNWGELRPTFSYGIFRIRSIWADVPNPLTARIEQLAAINEELEAKLADAVEMLELWHDDSDCHDDLEWFENRLRQNRTTLTSLQGDKA